VCVGGCGCGIWMGMEGLRGERREERSEVKRSERRKGKGREERRDGVCLQRKEELG